MCDHVFVFPEEKRENYNQDGKTITGVCKHCGVKQKAFGRRWAIDIEENFLKQIPYGETRLDFVNTKVI